MRIREKQINFFKIFYTFLVFVFLGLLLVTFLSLFGIPENLRIFVVETGSMEPSIPTGSVIFTTPANEYQKDDVITYRGRMEEGGPKNFIVTHRVSEVTRENGDSIYETKGDANEDVDPNKVNEIDVIGKTLFHIPYIGYAVGFAKTQMGFVLLVIIPAVIIIYNEFMTISAEFRKKDRQKKEKSKGMKPLNWAQ